MGKNNFRGEFKAQSRISTTLNPEMQRLAWEKAIPWSEALEFGIKKLAYGEQLPNDLDYGTTMENETEKNQIEQLKKALVQMQGTINVLENKKN